jgi:beta-lactam-binding protein with PASTA domain
MMARNGEAQARQAVAAEPPPAVIVPVETPPGTVPDVRGLSAREATRKLIKVGLSARLQGNGFVVSQDPAPGEPVVEGGICRLTLERDPLSSSASAQP